MAATIPAFTDPDRVLDLVGALGIELRQDDVPDADATMDYAVEQGTVDVAFYLSAYDLTLASQNQWVQVNATWFAVKYLCQRRLNDVPKSVADECERREKLLQLVLERKATAPGLAKSRRGGVVSNYQVDLRRWNNQVRVDKNRSTGVAKDYVRPSDNSPDNRG